MGQFAKAYQGLNQENICIATKIAAYPWRLTRQSIVNTRKSSSQSMGRNADLVHTY
ncbi:Aldo/keto reductase [Richelia intracellularis HM01]|nr:Aldo/keto reductase [Richelia intracellularis HM01]